MGELWTPLREGPHEAFVERLYRVVSRFAEEHGVEKPLVEVELNDGARFVIDQIIPEPGYGISGASSCGARPTTRSRASASPSRRLRSSN